MSARYWLILIALLPIVMLTGCWSSGTADPDREDNGLSLKRDVRAQIEDTALQPCMTLGTNPDLYTCQSADFQAMKQPVLTQDEKDAGILDRLCGQLVIQWVQPASAGEIWAPAVFEVDRLGWHGLVGSALHVDTDTPVLGGIEWAKKGCGTQQDFVQTEAALTRKNVVSATEISVLQSEIRSVEMQHCGNYAAGLGTANVVCRAAEVYAATQVMPSLADRLRGVSERVCGIPGWEFVFTGDADVRPEAYPFTASYEKFGSDWRISRVEGYDGNAWQAMGCGDREHFEQVADQTRLELERSQAEAMLVSGATPVDQSPHRLVGYDFRLIESTDNQSVYAIGIAVENVAAAAVQGLDIRVSDAYVETQDGGAYPVQWHSVPKRVHADHVELLSTSVIDAIEIEVLAPSMLVLGSMSLGETKDERLAHVWELTFALPRRSHPGRLIVPDANSIDLKSVPAREDLKLPMSGPTDAMPFSFQYDGHVNLTISNPRLFDHEHFGRMIAIDVEIENQDRSHSRTIDYSFTVIDPHGLALNPYATDCDDIERNGVLPINYVQLQAGEETNGVVCVTWNPNSYNDSEQVWTWHTVEEFDPRALGLDTTGTMRVADVEATFDELRTGIQMTDGRMMRWIGNRRTGVIAIQEKSVHQISQPILGDAHLAIRVGENWYSRPLPRQE